MTVLHSFEIDAVGRVQSFGAGRSDQPILLDDTKCTGMESSLLQCQTSSAIEGNNCEHSEDAGAVCSFLTGE